MDHLTVASIVKAMSPLFPPDTSIAVTDTRQYLYYRPGRIDLKIKPGDSIREGTATHLALCAKQKVALLIDREVLGISYYGMSVPLIEHDLPGGCVTAILPAKPKQPGPSLITIRNEDRWIPVPYEQVIYFEAQNRKTAVHTELGSGFHKLTLQEWEWLLPEDKFIRCHRSYIVNLGFIDEIHPDSHSTFMLIMKDRSKVPVSQTYSALFRKTLGF